MIKKNIIAGVFIIMIMTNVRLYAEDLAVYYPQDNVLGMYYKNGSIYYTTKNINDSSYFIKRINSISREENTIKQIHAQVLSSIIISDKNDIVYITWANGLSYINIINTKNTKNHNIKLECNNSKVFSPLIINNNAFYCQTSCSDMYIYDFEGNKIMYKQANGMSFTKEPQLIDDNKILTGNNSNIYLLQLGKAGKIPTPGIIPEDPPIKNIH